MANPLLKRLSTKNKKGLFKASQSAVSYKTGFLPFDFRNGYKVEVRDMNENLVETYNSLGLVGGTFVTTVGKSGTAKTTAAIQWAAAIVRPFESGFVLHFDLEQALTYTRIKNVTGYSQQELRDKYVLKQEDNYIDDIFDAIIEISKVKEESPEDFKYDSGLKDEFGDPIRLYVPTVVIIDSIPTLASKDKGIDKMALEGSTYANRAAKDIAQFYKRLMPIIKKYNIIVMAINHINTKIEINPMMKTQPQLMYLKMDESLPGGNAPVYYANNLFKFVSMSPKCNMEDDGFDGFKVRCEFLKSRTNKAGQSCILVYNQLTGFDPILTLLEYAMLNELVEGRNPYRRFVGFPDVKFNTKTFKKQFLENPDLQRALFEATVPVLERNLEVVDPDKEQKVNMLNVYESVFTELDDEE